MTQTATPSWTDPATALVLGGFAGPQTMPLHSVLRGTLDLSNKPGAYLVCMFGRGDATGITGNVFIRVRRMLLTKTLSTPGSGVEYVGGNTTGSTAVIVKNTTVASGVTVIDCTATPTGFGATGAANLLFIGVTTPITNTNNVQITNAEFVRMAAAWSMTNTTGNTAIWVDAPTKYTKLASEYCYNQAEVVGPLWLPGGCLYEVIFDYAAATAGGPLVVAAYYQTYDSDVVN